MIKKDIRRNGQNIFNLDSQKDLMLARGDTETRIKTEMCRNWEAGSCEYGDKCFFAHGHQELREKNTVKVVKDQKCENFCKFGYCISGNKCNFSHLDDNRDEFLNSKKKLQGSPGEKYNPPSFIDLESRNPYRV